jgi:hypothetical protein
LFYVFEVYCLQYTSVLRHKSQKFKGRRLAKGTRSEKIKPDKIRQGITRHDTTRQDNNKRRQDNNKTRQDNRKVREDNNKRRLDNNKTRPQQDETGQDKGRYEPGCCVCLAEGWASLGRQSVDGWSLKNKTREDKNRQDKGRRGITRQDTTRQQQDKRRLDKRTKTR